MTQAGAIIGTPEYMAPEQVTGEAVDHRVDLYAMGAVLYECVTGRTPLSADTPYQMIARLLEDQPEPPRKYNFDVPPALEALIADCGASASGAGSSRAWGKRARRSPSSDAVNDRTAAFEAA